MNALDINIQFEALTPVQKSFAVGFFLGGTGMVHNGFTSPHKDQDHATWALEHFVKAIEEAKISKLNVGIPTSRKREEKDFLGGVSKAHIFD